MKKIFLTLALTAGIMASAQVKIGDDVTNLNANSLLELESTSKGVLFPRVTLTGTTDATTVGTQIAGMTVYNTATISDVTEGMYTSNGTIWVKLGSSTPAYQSMRGKVTPVSASSYTVASDDFTIVTTHNAQTTITFPALTNTAADIGRVVYVFNNNTVSGSTLYVGINSGNSVTNQFRGRTFVWSGSQWINIGI